VNSVRRLALARARDGLLLIAGGVFVGYLPKLIWGILGLSALVQRQSPPAGFGEVVYPWLLGVALVIAVLMVVSGIAILTELPLVGKAIRVIFSYAAMLALASILIGPMIWMVCISLKPPKSPIPPLNETLPVVAVQGHTKLDLHWENYDTVLNNPTLPVKRFFMNTLFVTVSIVVLQLLITSLAAYGLSRLRWKGREAVFWMFLGSMMFAGTVTQIPVYLMLRSFGWLDTYLALIVPGISSSFAVFLLRQFFLQIPIELDEAARIDGAGDWTIYAKIIMPLSKAALATAGAFAFFGAWRDFMGPLIYTNSTEMRTLEVGLSVFKNSYGGNNWPLQMAAAMITMAPLLLVFFFVQRYFTKGIMLGSIK
jgi:multiple sugar transport system permease protein